jgi:chromosome segregation ATPase
MATIEERLGTLDMRVDNLETWAGPGQAEALAEGQRELRADLAKVRQTQDRHTRMLADLISDVAGLKTSVSVLEADNASLKTSFATLQADVVGLKADVATLQADVTTLKTDVAGLTADMAEVKGTLAEILRRLPVPPPGA